MSEAPSLKQRMKNGEIVSGIGVSMDLGKKQLEETIDRNRPDFLSVDSQHGAFSEDRLVAFCAEAEALDTPVQFRIKHTRHAYLIGNYLDLGPTGIMVPQVEDTNTVNEAIDMFYYPQQGMRSWGGNARRGIDKRPDRLEYAAWWNGFGVFAIQLESVNAITNAARLARPGVDFVSFGPNDLLYSIEGYPEFPLRTVDDCVRHVAQQLKDSDVRVGIAIHSEEEREKYLAMGVTVFQ